jgi:predicted enzyme related to lactoylglutathione lyase
MGEVASIRAVLFAKDLSRVAAFYSAALGMTRGTSDESHTRLERSGFTLIIHQIPRHIADTIAIDQPPARRVGGSVRLDYPVENIDNSRAAAKSLGGDIDELPPAWADRGTNFYLGHDPEGNVFGVSEQAA